MSAVIPEGIKTEILFALGSDEPKSVSNVYIRTKIAGMESFDCKAHYSKLGFKNAVIIYDRVEGLYIRVGDSTIKENKPGMLFISKEYIICVGVDDA